MAIIKHGGKRKGAGRKTGFRMKKSAKKEATVVKRIPKGLIEAVDEMIERYNKSKTDPNYNHSYE